MQTAIATICLSGDLAEKLEAAAAAGFDGVEIFEADLVTFDGSRAEVRQRLTDLGLTAIAYQPFRDFEGWDEPRRARTMARARRKLEAMGELGCDLLMVCTNVSPEAHGGIDRAAEDFAALGEVARSYGVRVGVEALAWGRYLSDYRDAWEVVRRADHPNIGIALDTFHICAKRLDLRPIESIPGDRIFLVQLSDAPWLDMDVMSWSRHYRCFPGQGDLPLEEFMRVMAPTGYKGPLSLEIFNDRYRAGLARSIAVDGRRSIINLLDRTRTSAPAGRFRNIAPLPPPTRCLGVEFIEFAVDENGAKALGKVLSGLGFVQSGKHVSKQVTRWSQGGINLVVNAEPQGFASSYRQTHGTSVCAFCLRVEGAASTMDRAERLLDKPFRQPVGPGELEVPAVRGLGESLIYFVDPSSDLAKVWDVDFRPTGAPGAGAGLTVVDHISQSMQHEEMLSWLLFYRSLFEVEKTGEVAIADPGGIVASQAVVTTDGALRIVLNGSRSMRTQSARFLTEFFGSGVQHIAFATDDIVATVKTLRANGVELLEMPENYYDDLEARIDLDPAALNALRDNGILYDRDEHGEYLQAYTRSFDNRFFFEIVERRGYRGFGALNAYVRLAAQARAGRSAAAGAG